MLWWSLRAGCRARRLIGAAVALCLTGGSAAKAEAAVSARGAAGPAIAVDAAGHGLAAFVAGRPGITAARVGSGELGTAQGLGPGEFPSVTLLASGRGLVVWESAHRIRLATLARGASRFSTPVTIARGDAPQVVGVGRTSAVIAWAAGKGQIRIATWRTTGGLGRVRRITGSAPLALAATRDRVLLAAVRGRGAIAVIGDPGRPLRTQVLSPDTGIGPPQLSVVLRPGGQAAAAVGGCCASRHIALMTRARPGGPLHPVALTGFEPFGHPVLAAPDGHRIVMFTDRGQLTTVAPDAVRAPTAHAFSAGETLFGGPSLPDDLSVSTDPDGAVDVAWIVTNYNADEGQDAIAFVYTSRLSRTGVLAPARRLTASYAETLAIASTRSRALVIVLDGHPAPELLEGPAPTARAATRARRPTCGLPHGATRDISSPTAVVYHRTLHTVDPVIRYSGCLRSSGRRRALATTPVDDVYASTDRFDFRLNGTFTAWVETGEDHYGSGGTSIVFADIGGRVATRTGAVGSYNGSPMNGPVTSAEVRELHISSVGTGVWVQHVSTASPTDSLVAFGPGRTQRVLDQGPAGTITEVRLVRTRVTWRHAGAPRRAQLRPPPKRPS